MTIFGEDPKLVEYRKQCREFLKPSENLSIEERLRNLQIVYNHLLMNEYPQTDGIISQINDYWDVLVHCVELYRRGLSAEAIDYMYNELVDCEEALFFDVVHEGLPLYRMRYSDEGQLFTKAEMFHVPYHMRHILGNERFSISGVPCLYLAGSTYTCWEELMCKSFENCNISSFKVDRARRVVKLEPIWNHYDSNRVIATPLALACFLEVSHKDGKYKEEYIIPQLLMQCILKYNLNHDEDQIEGIAYLSSKVFNETLLFDDSHVRKDRYFNFVFPALLPYDEQGLSKHLLEIFQYSSPETYGRLHLKYPNGDSRERKSLDQYDHSAFAFMEGKCSFMRIAQTTTV